MLSEWGEVRFESLGFRVQRITVWGLGLYFFLAVLRVCELQALFLTVAWPVVGMSFPSKVSDDFYPTLSLYPKS